MTRFIRVFQVEHKNARNRYRRRGDALPPTVASVFGKIEQATKLQPTEQSAKTHVILGGRCQINSSVVQMPREGPF